MDNLANTAPWQDLESVFRPINKRGDRNRYPDIVGEVRVNRTQAGPLRRIQVLGAGDCFWHAFAMAYYHDTELWRSVKSRTRYWFEYVLQNPNHLRQRMYQRLDNAAGSGTITGNEAPLLTLGRQLRYLGAWASDEMFQVVADCFDVELIVFSQFNGKGQFHPTVVRGAHNRRQILLAMTSNANHFDALLHHVQGQSRQDYRYVYHMGAGNVLNNVFEIFPGERPEALVGMPLMLDLPANPTPMIPMPAAEKKRLQELQRKKKK